MEIYEGIYKIGSFNRNLEFGRIKAECNLVRGILWWSMEL